MIWKNSQKLVKTYEFQSPWNQVMWLVCREGYIGRNSLTIGFVCTQLLPLTQMIVNNVVSCTKQITTWNTTLSNNTSSYVTCVKWYSVALKNLRNKLATIYTDVVTRDVKTLRKFWNYIYFGLIKIYWINQI